MEFKLFYLGHVVSNADSSGKHQIRECFHTQLEELWKLPPLNRHPEWLKNDSKLVREIGGRGFAFLVAKDLEMYAELDVDVLKAQGTTSFRDIDNKLKTICDALSLPARSTRKKKATTGAHPFKCLLEDDRLIYRMNVNTEYLLGSNIFKLAPRQTMWIINVRIRGNLFDDAYRDLIV